MSNPKFVNFYQRFITESYLIFVYWFEYFIHYLKKSSNPKIIFKEISQVEFILMLYAVANEAITYSKIEDLVISECF